MRLTRAFFCDHYEIPLPPGHKFPVAKYRLLRALLESEAVLPIVAAGLAPVDRILLVHDPAYVEGFLNGSLDPRVMRRIGFPWSPSMMRRTLASVGGTLLATDDALRFGVGAVLAGGTHHAFRDEGSGFCVFNDLAISIASLRQQGRIRRAAILDLDVHQGDGTAALFEGDADTLTISLHGKHNFPFRKRRSVVDVEFENGAGDDEYLPALRQVLPQILDFQPDLVIFQSGVDALEHDTLGRLKLTFAGLSERDRLVFSFCQQHRFPLAITMGGGYSQPIELTVEAHAQTYRLAARVFSE